MITAAPRYTKFMIVMHWTMAILVVGAYVFSEDGRRVRIAPPTLHFAFGLAVLLLVVPRLFGRVLGGAPPPQGAAGTWLPRIATWVHRVFYLLLIAVPLTGWYSASRLGVPISILGLTVPPIAAAVDGKPGPVAGLHSLGGNIILQLAVLHAALALWHHFVRRDDTLRRMNPL